MSNTTNMAQLDVLIILPILVGLIPILILHYSFVMYIIIPCFLANKKMRNKKINFL